MSELLENLSNVVQLVCWPIIIWKLIKLNEPEAHAEDCDLDEDCSCDRAG